MTRSSPRAPPAPSRRCSRGSGRRAPTSPRMRTSARSSSATGSSCGTNYWYAGRYSFVGYSVLYYPLAAVLGIRLLAALSSARRRGVLVRRSAALGGRRRAGRALRLRCSRPGSSLTGGVPVRPRRHVRAARPPRAAGAPALALRALRRPDARLEPGRARPARHRRSRLGSGVRLASLAGRRRRCRGGDGARPDTSLSQRRSLSVPRERSPRRARLLRRRDGMHVACRRARVLRPVFGAYAVAVVGVWIVPTDLGENVARLRYLAFPLALLVLALRRWRPVPVAVLVASAALAWNVTPLVAGWNRGAQDVTRRAAVWRAPPLAGSTPTCDRATASRRSTRRRTGPRTTSRSRASRSCAAGSGKRTSRRTRSSIAGSPLRSTSRGCARSASRTSCCRTRLRTTARGARRRSFPRRSAASTRRRTSRSTPSRARERSRPPPCSRSGSRPHRARRAGGHVPDRRPLVAVLARVKRELSRTSDGMTELRTSGAAIARITFRFG